MWVVSLFLTSQWEWRGHPSAGDRNSWLSKPYVPMWPPRRSDFSLWPAPLFCCLVAVALWAAGGWGARAVSCAVACGSIDPANPSSMCSWPESAFGSRNVERGPPTNKWTWMSLLALICVLEWSCDRGWVGLNILHRWGWEMETRPCARGGPIGWSLLKEQFFRKKEGGRGRSSRGAQSLSSLLGITGRPRESLSAVKCAALGDGECKLSLACNVSILSLFAPVICQNFSTGLPEKYSHPWLVVKIGELWRDLGRKFLFHRPAYMSFTCHI